MKQEERRQDNKKDKRVGAQFIEPVNKEQKKQGSDEADLECVCSEKTDKKAEQTDVEQKPEDYYDQLLRLRAEFENYRKRIDKEKPELIKWGKIEILNKLLPLYDVVMQAHEHINKIKGEESFDSSKSPKTRPVGNHSVVAPMETVPSVMNEIVRGLEMIFKEFSKVFESEEIREMDVMGRPYDPMAVEIMGVVEGDDSNDGKVVEELQKGFYIGDKVLRPARVKIAKKKV